MQYSLAMQDAQILGEKIGREKGRKEGNHSGGGQFKSKKPYKIEILDCV